MSKKIRNIILFLFAITYIVITISFVSNKKDTILCNKLEINIDTTVSNFIKKDIVLDLIDIDNERIYGAPIKSIRTDKLEGYIEAYPSVKSTEVYKSYDGIVHIDIEQRLPIMRVISGAKGYYVDEDGLAMSLCNDFTAHVLIVNGKVDKIQKYYAQNIADNSNECKFAKDIFSLAHYISNDSFWKNQIEQIYVSAEDKVILIPRVGAHVITLGRVDNYEQKLKNLFALYSKVLNTTGWKKYKEIKLQFENQIVCVKK